MLSRGAECVFVGFILYVSGARAKSICALKGSSVDLRCSAQRSEVSMKWFTVPSEGGKNQIVADGKRVNIFEESNFTLTLNDLRESDQNSYCCSREENECQGGVIQLRVADLQVEVFPARGKRNVSLMCSSSCPLTESPANYSWFKNTEFLYQDWSPWYQELISSEGEDTYSCALTGHEHLRAPEVSLDSLTRECFTVTYAKGRMCSHQQGPEDERCSISFPKALHVQNTNSTLECKTNCTLTKDQTITWYKNRRLEPAPPSPVPSSSQDIYSCAVNYLISDEVCIQDSYCHKVNYAKKRICALGGSPVNISSKYWDSNNQESYLWYKMTRSDSEAVELINSTDRIKFEATAGEDPLHFFTLLMISKVKKDDSAKYIFTRQRDAGNWLDLPGVTLVVTEMRVKFTPSAEVTEGQRVTLACTTSCPLADSMNYIWYLNNRSLNWDKRQSKYLVLDPVSSEHAGNYSCGVEKFNTASHQKTLTVHQRQWAPAAVGMVGTLLVIIPIIVIVVVFLRIRRKTTSILDHRTETSDQISPAGVSAQPTEEADIHYSIIQFPQKSDVIYSELQPHQPAAEQKATYAVVNFMSNPTTTSE